MKIAQVCPYDFSRPGGVKSHILSLSKYLRRRGHEVDIIAPNVNATGVQEAHVHFFGKSRSVHLGGTKIDVNIALGDEKKELKAFLNQKDFDIIHYHTIWNPLLPLQIRSYSRAKNVATFHDTPADSKMGRIIGKTLMPLAASAVIKYLDAVISVSLSQAKYIRRFSSRKIDIIPNGIDLEIYQRGNSTNNLPNRRRSNILFLGRLEPRKGLFYALEAYKKLKPKYSDLSLTIAGDGDLRAAAVKYVENHQLEDIEFLGFVNEDTKIRLFKEAEMYLAPALYGESFGIVLLEALALGTPVVGFGNEGYLNVMEGRWQEFFPGPGDIDALCLRIEQLYNSEELRSEMCQWGISYVEKFDWQIIAHEIEKIYQHLIR